MSPTLRPRVILASAGTGKTWQLTTRALELYARGIGPERILASTFTRKASGEILSRVFARLAAAASDERRAAELGEALCAPDLAREDFEDLTLALARNVHQLRISTLDAFFARLAELYAPELGLPPDWRIAAELEIEHGKSEALARSLGEQESEEWLALLREIERRPASRRVHEVLLDVVRDAHALYAESGAAAWRAIEGPAAQDERVFATLRDELARATAPLTASGKPDSRWAKALQSAVACVERADWEALFRSGIGAKVLAGEFEFYSHPISEKLGQVFRDLVLHAAADLAARLDRQNHATWKLFERLDRQWRALQVERGLYRFDDLPRMLAQEQGGVASRERLEELAWRLDARLDHLLLDEFQDTSSTQWRILAPLAEELAADGTGERSVFVVGDSKQSIYGWRGAEPRLLEELAASLHVEPELHSRSRRSAPVVIAAVNQVFETLDSNPMFEERPEELPVARAWRERFQHHDAARTDLRGAVRIFSVAVEDGDDVQARERRVLERAVELAVEHRRRAPSATIALLVRRNRHLPFVVHRLKEAGLAASGEGGSPLTDSAAVQAALSLLVFGDHPQNTAARFHVESSIFARCLGLDRPLDDRAAEEFARARRREWLEDGYAAFFERLRPALADSSEFERQRFAALIELAIAWSGEQGLRPREFVERVREERVDDSSRALVQVMTVHAAKGLEFDVVILAELEREWRARSGAFLWRRRGGDPRAELDVVTRHANEGVRTILERAGYPLLARLERDARDRSTRDELSTLYVALTRAVHALDLVWCEGERGGRFCASALLRQAFAIGEPDRTGCIFRHAANDESWPEHAALAAAPPQDAALARATVRFERGALARELARTSPSQLETQLGPSFELVGPARRAARVRGTRFHAWFERIEWLDEFDATDEDLAALATRRGLGGPGLEDDLGDFRAMLGGAVVEELFARERYDGELEVWRERRFQRVLPSARAISPGAATGAASIEPGAATGAASIETGAFDRVVVMREAGRATSAELIDFKTDALPADAEALARAAEHYRPQLEAYRAALADLLELEPSKIRATLFFVEPDRTVAI